mmetsp:Transcript_14202/g.29444  ORF Transcript_14202/g.29444 Transcript_14202/m.29444 type:complete len:213 (+) Transcript_14202:1148-1786(+)
MPDQSWGSGMSLRRMGASTTSSNSVVSSSRISNPIQASLHGDMHTASISSSAGMSSAKSGTMEAQKCVSLYMAQTSASTSMRWRSKKSASIGLYWQQTSSHSSMSSMFFGGSERSRSHVWSSRRWFAAPANPGASSTWRDASLPAVTTLLLTLKSLSTERLRVVRCFSAPAVTLLRCIECNACVLANGAAFARAKAERAVAAVFFPALATLR